MGAILINLPVEAATVRLGVLDLQRLRAGAMRLSALMEIPVLHIFTHDSIGVGEDGPHQPVEQLLPCAPSGLDHPAPGGCQRGRRGLAHDHAIPPRARGPDP